VQPFWQPAAQRWVPSAGTSGVIVTRPDAGASAVPMIPWLSAAFRGFCSGFVSAVSNVVRTKSDPSTCISPKRKPFSTRFSKQARVRRLFAWPPIQLAYPGAPPAYEYNNIIQPRFRNHHCPSEQGSSPKPSPAATVPWASHPSS
ncbi:hypothetical protein TPAR_00988, partial [Tolypocladium paradoxum]